MDVQDIIDVRQVFVCTIRVEAQAFRDSGVEFREGVLFVGDVELMVPLASVPKFAQRGTRVDSLLGIIRHVALHFDASCSRYEEFGVAFNGSPSL